VVGSITIFDVSASIGVAKAWGYAAKTDCVELLRRMHTLGRQICGIDAAVVSST